MEDRQVHMRCYIFQAILQPPGRSRNAAYKGDRREFAGVPNDD
ncbi:hypothetical protein ACFGVS_15810 [Mucilaginibacter sp. AW1-7]